MSNEFLKGKSLALTFPTQWARGYDLLPVLDEGPDSVLNDVLDSAIRLTRASSGQIFLHDPLKEDFYIAVQRGRSNYELTRDLFKAKQIGRLVSQTKRAYVLPEDPFLTGAQELKSEVAVPLFSGDGGLIGILNLQSDKPSAFDDDVVRMLSLLASQSVIALQNASIYYQATNQAKRFRLLWQTGLQLIEISDLSDLDHAYDVVAQTIKLYKECEVVFRLLDKATNELVLVKESQSKTSLLERIPMGTVKDLYGKTFVFGRLDQSAHAQFRSYSQPSTQSLLIVPLQIQEYFFGTLTLSSEIPEYFQEDDVELMQGLAQQLSLCIHRLEISKTQKELEVQAKHLLVFGELGQSVFGITHKLANELGLVSSYIDHLRGTLNEKGVLDESIDKQLRQILRDVENVLYFSRDLKKAVSDYARSDGPDQIKTISVGELLEDTLLKAYPPHIQVRVQLESDLRKVRVVPGQIVDVLGNLISNAIDAMPEGGHLTINAYNSDSSVNIDVSDTGPGIPPSIRPHIFKLFYSTKQSSGFGLWSARRFALANGGDLAVKSSPQGTEFTLKLPIAD